MKFNKKLISRKIIVFISIIIFLSIGIKTARAANFMETVGLPSSNTQSTKPTTNTWLEFARQVNSNTNNVTSWTGYPLFATINHLTAMVVGYPDATGKLIPRTGALSSFLNLTTSMYAQRPSSVKIYVASVFQNSMGFGSAYAAPAGWKGPAGPGADFFPSTIFEWWQQIRNIALVFMIIVIVVIGFMVMFRFKIDPQTVVAIESSLPKIAVSLILITLSYAIVGFVIDIAFIGINLIAIFILQDRFKFTAGIVVTDIFTDLLGNYGGSGKDLLSLVGQGIWDLLTKLNDLGGLMKFIIAMTMISSVAKLFFGLLTKYVTLMFGAIFGPLVFLWGSLPGQYDTTSGFIKSMISAALAFPITLLFLSLASYFASATGAIVKFTALEPLPTTSTFLVNFPFTQLIALGLLMTSGNVPQMIDDALSVKQSTVGSGVAEAGGALRKIPILGSFLG